MIQIRELVFHHLYHYHHHQRRFCLIFLFIFLHFLFKFMSFTKHPDQKSQKKKRESPKNRGKNIKNLRILKKKRNPIALEKLIFQIKTSYFMNIHLMPREKFDFAGIFILFFIFLLLPRSQLQFCCQFTVWFRHN